MQAVVRHYHPAQRQHVRGARRRGAVELNRLIQLEMVGSIG
jgi:hypothetical protein